MAGRTDEVDEVEARRLAWTLGGLQPVARLTDRPAAPPDLDEAQLARLRIHVLTIAAEIEKKLEGARTHPKGPERAAALESILRECAELDLELLSVEEPHATWLVRAYLEAGGRLDPKVRRTALLALMHAGLARVDGRFALLLEAVEAGDLDLTLLLAPETNESGPWVSRLSTRLISLLDGGAPIQRLLAAAVLARRPFPAAVPALQRALTTHDIEVRTFALEALLACGPETIGEERLLALIDETLTNGCPWRRDDDDFDDPFSSMERTLTRAAAALKPKGLAALLDARCTHYLRFLNGEGSWPRALLAVVAPERILPHLTRWIDAPDVRDRSEAVALTAHLANELARPLLAVAADDPDPEVTQAARAQWFERYAESCPVPRTVGPTQRMLASPSPEFHARLKLLDGPLEAREALAEALLRGPATTESLLLLLHFLDGARENSARPALPDHHREWIAVLGERFSKRTLAEAVLLRATSRTRAYNAIDFIDTLAKHGLWPTTFQKRAQRLLLESLETDGAHVNTLEALEKLGVPPAAWELLWKHALAPAPTEPLAHGWDFEPPITHYAIKALATIGACPPLNAAILEALGRPQTLAGYTVSRLAGLASKRRMRSHLPLLESYVFETGDLARFVSRISVAHWLLKSGRLDLRWIGRKLGHPEQPEFAIAAALSWTEKVRGARPKLWAALESSAREGHAAVDALIALTELRLMKGREPLINRVLLAASPHAQLCYLELASSYVGFPHRAPVIARLLASDDEVVSEGARRLLRGIGTKTTARIWERARTLASPARQAEIDTELAPREKKSCWTTTEIQSVLEVPVVETEPQKPSLGWWGDDEDDDAEEDIAF